MEKKIQYRNKRFFLQTGQITTANSTFAIGGVSCSADSLVVAEISVAASTFVVKSPPIANLQNVRRNKIMIYNK